MAGRENVWNDPNEPVVFWPLLSVIAFVIIVYYYPKQIAAPLKVLGAGHVYNMLWGNRGGCGRVAVIFALLGTGAGFAYQVEQLVELWGSWITTGTFTKAREPTLYRGIGGPIFPAFATVVAIFLVIEFWHQLGLPTAYRIGWAERSTPQRWLIVIGILITMSSSLGSVADFLQNFNYWITVGKWPHTQAGPAVPLTPKNPFA